MISRNERIHRMVNMKPSDFHIGQVAILTSDGDLKSAQVIFDISVEGEIVILKTWPASEANLEEARRLAKTGPGSAGS